MKKPRVRIYSLNEIFEEYNDNLPELPQGVKELQDRMLLGSGWTEDDGPYPGVFYKRGCLWSVVWQTSGGVVTPRSYWPVSNITCQALIFEMLDYCERETHPGGNHNRSMMMMKFLLELRELENGHGRISRFMKKWNPPSGTAPDYICAFDPPNPNKIIIARCRPGWPTKTDMLPPQNVPRVQLGAKMRPATDHIPSNTRIR